LGLSPPDLNPVISDPSRNFIDRFGRCNSDQTSVATARCNERSIKESDLARCSPEFGRERLNPEETLLRLGNATEQPGADLNGAWYLRNAKIFAKLTQIAQPADRVLVVFGSGHAYWLRHFVQNTPGFQLIESDDYLQ
jgi:hypothetical protein